MAWPVPYFANPFASKPIDPAASRAAVATAAAAARNNSLAAQAAQVFPIVHLWREPEAHPNGTVPGWLEVGTIAFLPAYGPDEKFQSLVDRMPPNLRNSKRVFPTIERGMLDAKVVPYKSLKIGTYTLVHSTKDRDDTPPDNKINCLRIADNDNIKSMLIHDALADSARSLTGCVAPGLRRNPGPGTGILDSAEAMEAIWALFGGHVPGTEVKLVVWSNAPGDDRTKETWGLLD